MIAISSKGKDYLFIVSVTTAIYFINNIKNEELNKKSILYINELKETNIKNEELNNKFIFYINELKETNNNFNQYIQNDLNKINENFILFDNNIKQLVTIYKTYITNVNEIKQLILDYSSISKELIQFEKLIKNNIFLFQKTIHNLNIENKNHILKIKECGFTNLIEWQKINGFVQKIYNIINKKDQKIENVNNNHISKEIKENIESLKEVIHNYFSAILSNHNDNYVSIKKLLLHLYFFSSKENNENVFNDHTFLNTSNICSFSSNQNNKKKLNNKLNNSYSYTINNNKNFKINKKQRSKSCSYNNKNNNNENSNNFNSNHSLNTSEDSNDSNKNLSLNKGFFKFETKTIESLITRSRRYELPKIKKIKTFQDLNKNTKDLNENI